jgi:adenosine/AMP kinase
MNNPVTQMMQLMQAGKNPNAVLQMLAQNNPQVRQVMGMINGKNPAQLEQMARNMARERGTTIEDVARSMGIQIPSNR